MALHFWHSARMMEAKLVSTWGLHCLLSFQNISDDRMRCDFSDRPQSKQIKEQVISAPPRSFI